MTLEQITERGFINGYSNFCKVEEAAKGEIRITVSVFAMDSNTAVAETVKSYNKLRESLK